jgi:hypothetical protein
MTNLTAKRLRSPAMDRRGRAAAAGIGLLRAGIGAGLLASPESLPRAMGVDRVSARRMSWAVRLFAVRDGLLGVLGMHAALSGRPLGPSLLAQAASDASDAATLAMAIRQRSVSAVPGLALVAFSVTGVAGILALARSVGRRGH